MKTLWVRKDYKEIRGTIPVLLTAPHVQPPRAEILIAHVVTRVAGISGAHALLGLVSRTKLDLNRAEAAGSGFRKRIADLIESRQIQYLLDIHGCNFVEGRPEIDLGTAGFLTARKETAEQSRLLLKQAGFDVQLDHYFRGESSPGNIIRSCGVEAIQIEIRKDLRHPSSPHLPQLIESLARLVSFLAAKNGGRHAAC